VRHALDDGGIVEEEFQGELPAEILDAACLDFVFDPVAVLDRLANLYRGVIDLELVRADPEAMEALAYVEFFPATEQALRRTVLHVSSNIWELAEAGDEDARALFAHEIGRIVSESHRALEDHEAMAG
jgi:hypothetical protein